LIFNRWVFLKNDYSCYIFEKTTELDKGFLDIALSETGFGLVLFDSMLQVVNMVKWPFDQG